ncbi:hypothetical protein H1Q63_36760 [Desmonostoc muscorum CCALA 125]|nr:hypothetical protein [Desmonostoc muscorum CCALA 125]
MAKRKKPTYLVKGSLRGEPVTEIISTNFIENYITQTMKIPGVEIESFTEVDDDYFGEVMNSIHTEIERLGWTLEQRREHLMKNRGKTAITLLTKQELVDFLEYLQSL